MGESREGKEMAEYDKVMVAVRRSLFLFYFNSRARQPLLLQCAQARKMRKKRYKQIDDAVLNYYFVYKCCTLNKNFHQKLKFFLNFDLMASNQKIRFG